MVEQTHSNLSPASKHSIFDDLFGSCTPLSGLDLITPTELEKVFQLEKPKFKTQSLSKLQVPSFHGGIYQKAQRIYSDVQEPQMDFNSLIDSTLPSSFEIQELIASHSPFKLGSVPTQKIKKQKQKKKEIQQKPKEEEKEILQMEPKESKDDESRVFTKVIDEKYSNADIRIKMKTRNEPFKSSIEERLYSSMKYEIKIHLDVGDESKFPCLLARAYLVDTIDSEIIPNSLDGIIECAMSESNDAYEGSLRIQISNTYSFHHTKTEYSLQIKFFNPKEVSDEISFASLISPSFKVFARKPNMKSEEKEKKVQKRKIKEEQITESQQKKKKKENEESNLFSFTLNNNIQNYSTLTEEKKSDQLSSIEFNEFTSCLEKLLEVKSKLKEEDQIIALNLVKLKIEELTRSSEEFQFN